VQPARARALIGIVRRRRAGGVDGEAMKPPEGESEMRPAKRSSRLVGLLAAVGFSVAMWAFIAMAVLGLVLKIMGSRH
jgi:hypothetical protein